MYSLLKARGECVAGPRAHDPRHKGPGPTHHGEQHVVQEQRHEHHAQHQLPGLSALLQQARRGVPNGPEHDQGARGLLLRVLGGGPVTPAGLLLSLQRRRESLTRAVKLTIKIKSTEEQVVRQYVNGCRPVSLLASHPAY